MTDFDFTYKMEFTRGEFLILLKIVLAALESIPVARRIHKSNADDQAIREIESLACKTLSAFNTGKAVN